MKLLVDTNIFIDVLQARVPFFQASAGALTLADTGKVVAMVPGHTPATVHFLIRRALGRLRADEAIDWLLDTFDVVPATAASYRRARDFGFADYEDGVVAAMAEQAQCDFVLTRNPSDFKSGPVAAITPSELLQLVGR